MSKLPDIYKKRPSSTTLNVVMLCLPFDTLAGALPKLPLRCTLFPAIFFLNDKADKESLFRAIYGMSSCHINKGFPLFREG